jgi:MFS family permease
VAASQENQTLAGEENPAALARQRMRALGGCGFLNGLAFSGLLTVLPLHATQTLGLSAAGYSRVLSLRMGGIVVGAIVLGAVSDRFGVRRVSVFCLVGAGLSFMLICAAPVWGFLILVPVVSGLLSASFVNINQMTQLVGNNKQGVANTVYRAAGTSAGMIGPILVTQLISHTAWVVGGLGAGLFAGAMILRSYPMQEKVARLTNLKTEVNAVVGVYREGLSHGKMMAYLALTLGVYALATSVDAFGAVRLTQELAAPAKAYGNVVAIASGLSLVTIVSLGAVLDKWPLKLSLMLTFCVVLTSLFCLGVCQSVFWTQVFLIATSVGVGASLAPAMMWLARVAKGGSMGGAFALQKVMNAALVGAGMLVMSVLVPVIGIQWLFICCACLGAVLVGCLAKLEEPGKSER